MNKMLLVPVLIGLVLLMDVYLLQGIKTLTKYYSFFSKKRICSIFHSLSVIVISTVLLYVFIPKNAWNLELRAWFFMIGFGGLLGKVFGIVPLVLDDMIRLVKWVYKSLHPQNAIIGQPQHNISRSEFLTKSSIALATLPIATMGYGILSGAHDYQVRKEILLLPNLPKSFDGFRIAQISDVHSGSCFNKIAVKGGIELLNAQKPDIAFFTGDLVDYRTEEVKEYIPIFNKIKAPLGVFSVTGNHDYGDYVSWASPAAKHQNFEDLKVAHKELGWQLLMNEHHVLEQNGDRIAILGVENWGNKARFPKYGKIDQAYMGTQDIPVKILLSHDPSHWDGQIVPDYKDIDLMLAGHTHGMQFGIEIPGFFKWSPIQYMYEQWGGMYKKGQQYLYVNRGYGYSGFPGRIGMPPEITIIELRKA